MDKPDERGIDLAILAFIGTRLAGDSIEKAQRNAEAMLEMFRFKKEPKP